MTQKRLEENYLYEKHFNQNYKKRDFGGRFLGEAKIVKKKKNGFQWKMLCQMNRENYTNSKYQ